MALGDELVPRGTEPEPDGTVPSGEEGRDCAGGSPSSRCGGVDAAGGSPSGGCGGVDAGGGSLPSGVGVGDEDAISSEEERLLPSTNCARER